MGYLIAISCFLVISNLCQAQIDSDNMYYDVEYRRIEFGVNADSLLLLSPGDTLKVSWSPVIKYMEEGTEYLPFDTLGWKSIDVKWQPIPSSLRKIPYYTRIELEPGIYKFRVWSHLHRPNNKILSKWRRSLAPSDEVTILIKTREDDSVPEKSFSLW